MPSQCCDVFCTLIACSRIVDDRLDSRLADSQQFSLTFWIETTDWKWVSSCCCLLDLRLVSLYLDERQQMYQVICTKYTSHLEAAKAEHLKKKVENSNDKQLFKFCQ